MIKILNEIIYRYFLTVTFKSFGELMHIDMEYNSSLFSIYGQRPHNKRNFSLVALINHSINYIKYDNVSWFSSEHKLTNECSRFPFGLTKPVCRFSRLKSLQYLCTYVICLNTKLEHVDKLPLPNSIKKYIYEIYIKYVYDV
jgi:suppressor of cytokine signaling 7